ncbi:MAG TPA: DUF1592 domain-containing protein [Polyangia bacterium]|nr:DUF1592 domain-containing protein [Polyangia bacterium]
MKRDRRLSRRRLLKSMGAGAALLPMLHADRTDAACFVGRIKHRTFWRGPLQDGSKSRAAFGIAALLSAGLVAGCSARTGSQGAAAGAGGSGVGPTGSGSAGASSSGGPASGTAGSGTVGGGGGAGGTSAIAIVTSGTPPAESAGPLIMRRLTYREYDHMLADLLGDTTAPAEGGNAWTPDAPNAVGYVAPTSVADLQMALYNQTADSVVETALQAVAAGKTAGKLTIPCEAPTTSAAETTCATQFITSFGLEAYRRPIAAAEQTDLLALFTKVRGLGLSFNESIGALVKGMIQSPNFLFHWEIGPIAPVAGSDGLVPLTSWQLASRLASTLWETTPDDTLLQAAQAGQLTTAAQVTTQVTRMLADSRASNGLFNFHEQWLFNFGSQGRDLTQPLTKTSALFTAAVAQGIQTEFADFVSSVYTGDGTLQALFTAPYTFVNHDLGVIYGVAGPATGFAKVALDPTKRGGIFTQTAFLATLANNGADNPVYRGLSIYLRVLCGTIGPPSANGPAVNFIANGTTRQSYAAHGMSACAAGCHSLFDPPGFSLENYDGIGAYRTTDANVAVDATGSFVTPASAIITFQNVLDLSNQLAQTAEAQTCVDRQWTRYILGRPETAAESGSMSIAYQKAAATKGFSIRDLVATLVQSKAFMYRQPSPGETL